MNWNNVNGNGMTLIGNKLGLFLDYGRSPHVRARARHPIAQALFDCVSQSRVDALRPFISTLDGLDTARLILAGEGCEPRGIHPS